MTLTKICRKGLLCLLEACDAVNFGDHPANKKEILGALVAVPNNNGYSRILHVPSESSVSDALLRFAQSIGSAVLPHVEEGGSSLLAASSLSMEKERATQKKKAAADDEYVEVPRMEKKDYQLIDSELKKSQRVPQKTRQKEKISALFERLNADAEVIKIKDS
ncbi:hypothetical protein Tco_1104967 [Tanacetum coccineum]